MASARRRAQPDGHGRQATKVESMEGSLMSEHTARGRARQRVGRFSEGIERLSDNSSKSRRGRFSSGIELLPETPSKLRRGRFSSGIERLPNAPSQLRMGSFGDGYQAVRQRGSAAPRTTARPPDL
jgi:hypothetical protein